MEKFNMIAMAWLESGGLNEQYRLGNLLEKKKKKRKITKDCVLIVSKTPHYICQAWWGAKRNPLRSTRTCLPILSPSGSQDTTLWSQSSVLPSRTIFALPRRDTIVKEAIPVMQLGILLLRVRAASTARVSFCLS